MANPNARDTKLIQYLNEAYGKEKELETALQAHIAMTTRTPYKKRLREHLKETKGHSRQLKTRIRELGGKAEAGPVSSGPTPVLEAASTLTSVASKAVAAAQGPLHAIRGTGEAEKMLKNAKTEYHNEFEEIATYTGIEALAEAVNDKDTAKLARGIRREEERMAKFLEKQIPQLAKAVAKEEIPAAERRNGKSRSSSRRSSSSRSRSSSNGSSRSSSGSRSSSSRSSGSRAKSSRSGSTSSRSGSRSTSSRAKSSGSRAKSSGSSRSGSTAKRSGSSSSRSRSTAGSRSR
jgi:ferritin-like metal-binding protein YciE